MEVVNVLPDLVIHQILQVLPTKAAVRMSFLSKQWNGVWCSAPVLDFDEGVETGEYDNVDPVDLTKFIEHRNFIRIVERSLKSRQPEHVLLDKFRLRIMRYVTGDRDIIDKCLSSVLEGSVKELDICLRISRLYSDLSCQNLVGLFYCISRRNLVNAKTLIVMKLEHVRIKNVQSSNIIPSNTRVLLLPNLKTMHLKEVHFDDDQGFFYLIEECPSIENLSITSCTLEFGNELHVSSSSLKLLEIEDCNTRIVTVDETSRNLEYFTYSSNFSPLDMITLEKSFNLKYINVQAAHLQTLRVLGCHEAMKATISTPNLNHLMFKGFLKSKLSVKAPNLTAAGIIFSELWDGDLHAFDDEPLKHFLALRNFLENISCPENATIFFRNPEDIIFPEDFQKKFSSPWLGVRSLFLSMRNPPLQMKDIPGFRESMNWLVPYAVHVNFVARR